MPLFRCADCGSIDNTACGGNYWLIQSGEPERYIEDSAKRNRPLCCECFTGTWHDRFPKKKPEEFNPPLVEADDNFYYSLEEMKPGGYAPQHKPKFLDEPEENWPSYIPRPTIEELLKVKAEHEQKMALASISAAGLGAAGLGTFGAAGAVFYKPELSPTPTSPETIRLLKDKQAAKKARRAARFIKGLK